METRMIKTSDKIHLLLRCYRAYCVCNRRPSDLVAYKNASTN